MASDGPSRRFPPLRLGLTTPQPSRCHHAQSLLAPSFYDPKTPHVIESPVTPSELRLSPAATISDDILSALCPPLHCASILQPTTPPEVVTIESWTICVPICLNRFTFAASRRPKFLVLCAYLYLFLFCLCFSDRNDSELQQGFSKGGNAQTVRHTAETHVDRSGQDLDSGMRRRRESSAKTTCEAGDNGIGSGSIYRLSTCR